MFLALCRRPAVRQPVSRHRISAGFAAYSWRIVVCRGCGVHLGWLFESTGHSFFGLIRTRLIEDHDAVSD